jgi:cytochrome o ubiquinol oxidase subunit II
VTFSLTSASVMNAFFIPQLGSMIYTMNGMTTRLNLQADQEGTFYGRSSHFSGDGFPGMEFKVRAVGGGAYDQWIAAARGASATLDRGSYAKLAEQSSDNPPATFRLADSELFQAIATQKVPPAQGPKEGRPDAETSPRPNG